MDASFREVNGSDSEEIKVHGVRNQGWPIGGRIGRRCRTLGGGREESGGRDGILMTKKENTRREEALHEAGLPKSAGGQVCK